jgi:cytochrome c oxidase subunit 2
VGVAGTYRGQCAEFCGAGHAHMTMTVVAMEPADFDAWLRASAGTDATRNSPPPDNERQEGGAR